MAEHGITLNRIRPATVGKALLFLALSWLLAILGVMGSALMANGWTDLTTGDMLMRSLVFTPVAAVALLAGDLLLGMVARRVAAAGSHAADVSMLDRFIPRRSTKSVLLFAGILLLFWAFWIIAFYPGSMNYDTYYQITQVYPHGDPVSIGVWSVPNVPVEGAQFSDHHPLFDTLIYGAFGWVSHQLFGTWNVGVFAVAVLQSIGTAIAFSYAFAYLRSIGTPRPLCIGAYVFVCLIPIFGNYASTVLKDMLFSGIYIVWFVFIIEIVRTRGKVLGKRRFLIMSIVLGSLLALTKKTGVYIVVGSMVLFALIYRGSRLRCLLQAAIPGALIWVLLPAVVFPLLNVVPGGKQEIMGTPFQMTARYVSLHENELSDEERQAIDDVLVYDTLADRYSPKWADPVKYAYVQDASRDAWVAYAKTWLVEGLRHPTTYLQAMIAMTTGFVAPGGTVFLEQITWDMENGGNPLLYQPDALAGWRDAATNLFNAIAATPVLNIVLWGVTYCLWIPALAFWICVRHAPRWLPVFIPVLLCIASIMLSPMYDSRYATPLIYTAPLLICLAGSWLAPMKSASHKRLPR